MWCKERTGTYKLSSHLHTHTVWNTWLHAYTSCTSHTEKHKQQMNIIKKEKHDGQLLRNDPKVDLWPLHIPAHNGRYVCMHVHSHIFKHAHTTKFKAVLHCPTSQIIVIDYCLGLDFFFILTTYDQKLNASQCFPSRSTCLSLWAHL